MYVFDSGNNRLQSFPFTTLADSPNGTTILSGSYFGSDPDQILQVWGIAFDWMRNLLYLNEASNQRLLILNTTEDNIEVITNVQLSVINLPISIISAAITIDQTSNSFYVLDRDLKIVVKFTIGSTTGTVIAGNMISNSIFNQFNSPALLALDSSGYLYITDAGYNRIVQLLNDHGDLRTIAGQLYQYCI